MHKFTSRYSKGATQALSTLDRINEESNQPTERLLSDKKAVKMEFNFDSSMPKPKENSVQAIFDQPPKHKRTVSLAEAFKQRKKSMAERLDKEFKNKEQKTKTYERRLEQSKINKERASRSRKQKRHQASRFATPLPRNQSYSVKVKEKASRSLSKATMERLAVGGKKKLSKKEMYELSKKNYKKLPEVKKRDREKKKKREMKERREKAKLYNQVRRIFYG
jgi:hypothetical protein